MCKRARKRRREISILVTMIPLPCIYYTQNALISTGTTIYILDIEKAIELPIQNTLNYTLLIQRKNNNFQVKLPEKLQQREKNKSVLHRSKRCYR